MIFLEPSVYQKIEILPKAVDRALNGEHFLAPQTPSRDIQVLSPDFHPDKVGLSAIEGQGRLLHDLANIELQAMELGFRGLVDFPEADPDFREELAELTLAEGRHLQMCLHGLEELGFQWGQWPIHLNLWSATAPTDSLLDRVTIVHRYLEGSGLDAGETLLKRLKAVSEGPVHSIIKTIVSEEVDHVQFGSRWYRHFCKTQKIDPDLDFPIRLSTLSSRVPKRIEKISRELRLKAGFSETEVSFLEEFRNKMRKA